MARKRSGSGKHWQVTVSLAALLGGLGLLALALKPVAPVERIMASVTLPKELPLPESGPRDSLGEAIEPEALAPLPEAPAQPSYPGIAEPAISVHPPAPATAHPVPSAHPLVPSAVPHAPPPAAASTWRRNAVEPGGEEGRPMIAIVIDDMGLDRRHSADMVAMPGPLTLSFMTYAEDLAAQSAAARLHGHEIMLHVPMEPLAARVNAGPNVLRLDQDPDEIRRRLDWDLGRLDGIVGINNHMGSRFTESSEAMALVMGALRERGLFFLDSRTTPHSVGAAMAREMGVAQASRDIFLDVDITDPAVTAELAHVETLARHNGAVIAIGHPHEATVEALRRWLPTLASKGFRQVPVSAIVARNGSATETTARAVSDVGAVRSVRSDPVAN